MLRPAHAAQLALLAVSACGWGPEDFTGKQCDSTRDCPRGMVCRQREAGAQRVCLSAADVTALPEEVSPEAGMAEGVPGADKQPPGASQTPLPPVSGQTTYCDVKPVLNTYCAGCHGSAPSGGAPAGFRLDVFGGGGVVGAHAMAQRISARAVVARTMPPSGALPAAQLSLLDAWVKAGAPDCDSTQTSAAPNTAVSFSADVQPILTSYCVSCHRGDSPPRKLNLEPGQAWAALMRVSELDNDYRRVVPGDAAQSLVVLGLADGLPDVVPAMPYGTAGLKQLSPDAYEVVRRWVEQGAPNN